jgi:hypothetical protein
LYQLFQGDELWNSRVPVEKLGEYELRRYAVSAGRAGKLRIGRLRLAVFEEFDLAQALFGFCFGFVRAAEIFAGFL